jgi:alkylation response protein AidB-like acyl-CoA dehydrogenase
MNFEYSEEQRALQDVLSRFIAKEYAFSRRRAWSASPEGFSRENWRRFAELGLLGVAIPEIFGGTGGGAVDTAIVMELLGRGLVLEPYLAAVVVAGGLVRDFASDDHRQRLLPAIVEGRLIPVLAAYEPGGRYELNVVVTRAARSATPGWSLHGRKTVVLGAPQAGQLIVSARVSGDRRDRDGISLFLVDPTAPGVKLSAYPTQDGGRAGELVLEDVAVGPEALLGTSGDAYLPLERAHDRGIAALCAEAVGIMSALVTATVEYLKTRKQFGVSIGKFQALQHRAAEMFIATEQARSMSYLASASADSVDDPRRSHVMSAAKALVGQSARFVGQQAVQLHGAMGVTDELDVSHHFKRLTAINATFGDVDFHLSRFSDGMLEDLEVET